MSSATANIQTEPAKPETAREDISGQNRFRRNVAFAWGGYLVNIATGFIMPRLISDRLGQTTLGIWDFAWSLVSYFGLAQLGLSGSVQRYVARYRAQENHEKLSASVSTIGLSLKASGLLVLLLTAITAIWILPTFNDRLGDQINGARWVIIFLGIELAISMMLTVYGGILVGCHRWDAHNTISAVVQGAMTVGMIAVLFTGGGLPGLALVHCVSTSAGEVARWWMARKVCSEFKMDFRLANWEVWREQARFSVKTLIPSVADLIANQSLSVLITLFLGPAMLAIYSRPRNLMGQGRVLAAKFGSILIPTASSLQAREDNARLQATFMKATRFLAFLTMPGIAIAAVFGDEVIRVWMGAHYIFPGLITILAIGTYPTLVQEPVWSILSGMNRHGRLALVKLVSAVFAAVTLGIGLKVFHWNLLGAAFAFTIPLFVVDLFIAPVMACRRVGISSAKYYRETYLKPLAGALPIVVCLEVVRQQLKSAPLFAGVAGLGATAILGWMLLIAYRSLKDESAANHS